MLLRAKRKTPRDRILGVYIKAARVTNESKIPALFNDWLIS
jgi:hypothetical protein